MAEKMRGEEGLWGRRGEREREKVTSGKGESRKGRSREKRDAVNVSVQ